MYTTVIKLLMYILVVGIIFLIVLFLFSENILIGKPLIFSEKTLLMLTWNSYKTSYVEASSGRVVDVQRGNITTSEGISYTMLRAVWTDDKETFDKTFSWAEQNLKRNDGLFSWLYGASTGANLQGIITSQGGQNNASDADTNIALALLFAANRWGDPTYKTKALSLLRSIWDNDVVYVSGIPYLAADNLEKVSTTGVIINPSYLEPYAYRIFSTLDKTHEWTSLVDSSYSILNKATASPLDKNTSAKLPPDWITLSKLTGEIIPNQTQNISTNFSFDALRVPWNIALDYEWFGDPRAKKYLDSLETLTTFWNKDKKIYTNYSHSGETTSTAEAPAIYGGIMGYFMWSDPVSAKEVYARKLVPLYNQDINNWTVPLSYYDDNWVWFGIALYNHTLPNLANSTTRI